MRNPKRIPLVLSAIGRYWSLHPDLRLGQLLGNHSVGYNTEDEALMRALAMPDHLQAMEALESETFEDMVERIAKAWKEEPCPPEEGPGCDPDLHNWDTAHPEDKEYARLHVRFTLRQAGLG